MNINFSITLQALLEQIANVFGAHGKASQMPILGNVMFTLTGDTFRTTCTDLEVELQAGGAFENRGDDGAFTVSAKKLYDIIRALPANTGTLNFRGSPTAEGSITVHCGTSRYKLRTLPSEDFPPSAEVATPVNAIISTDELLRLLTATRYAMAVQDARREFNGMLFEIKGDNIHCVATNGHRLALATGNLTKPCGETVTAIVSHRGVDALWSLVQESTDDIVMEFGKTHVRIQSGERTAIASLVDGTYPDYRAVLPRDLPIHLQVSRTELADIISRSRIVADPKNNAVTLAVSGNAITFSSSSDDESGSEVMDVDYDGSDTRIAVNANYLLDVLKTANTDTIILELRDQHCAMAIKSGQDGQSGHVIMPVRL